MIADLFKIFFSVEVNSYFLDNEKVREVFKNAIQSNS